MKNCTLHLSTNDDGDDEIGEKDLLVFQMILFHKKYYIVRVMIGLLKNRLDGFVN